MDITELHARIFVINEINSPITRQREKDGKCSSFQVMNLILFECEGSRVNLTIFGENSVTLHKCFKTLVPRETVIIFPTFDEILV
jgi:hypothetical protein